MPVYLPPISRRKFLTGSAAAAAVALAGCASPHGMRHDANSIALFSDIHVAADPEKLGRGINMTEHFKTARNQLLALDQLPGTMFINGDLAFNSGEAEDYKAVLGLLRPIRESGIPIHMNMGNHDDRAHFWSEFSQWKTVPADLPGRQAAVAKMDKVNWFLLDSLIATLTTPGKLGPEQLKWLAAQLDANPNKPAIVMVHHQVGSLSPEHPGGGLEDGADLLAILRPRRQVKAYLFGHTHRWSATQDDTGLYFVNLPTVAYPFDAGMPSAWVQAQLINGGARLQLHCIDTAHKDQDQIVNLAWRV